MNISTLKAELDKLIFEIRIQKYLYEQKIIKILRSEMLRYTTYTKVV